MSNFVDFIEMAQDEDYLILDTEPTGFRDAEICDIAIIEATGNVLLDTLVRPMLPIPADVTAIHGITNEMIADVPMWSDIQPRVRDLLAEQNVIIYNAVFDRLMMHSSDEHAGIARVDYANEADYWCAMEAFAEFYGQYNEYHQSFTWKPLGFAANHFKMAPAGQAHRALADCLATLHVVKGMVQS